MPLSEEEINKLLTLPSRRRGKKAGPDTSVRDYQTWFKLATKMVDEDTKELLHCANPNCLDTDHRGSVVAMVNEQYMCRRCFLGGWLLDGNTTE